MFPCTIQKGNVMAPTDVCKTPTPVGSVPIPYPNTGMMPMADPPCPNLLIMGSPALTLECKVEMTNGDQAGVAGGVVSGQIMGQAQFTKGSTKLFIEGSPAVRMTDPSVHNKENIIGSCLVPSQSKMIVMS